MPDYAEIIKIPLRNTPTKVGEGPFFHAHGWSWGTGFKGPFVDSMRFELGEQTILNLVPRIAGAS